MHWRRRAGCPRTTRRAPPRRAAWVVHHRAARTDLRALAWLGFIGTTDPTADAASLSHIDRVVKGWARVRARGVDAVDSVMSTALAFGGAGGGRLMCQCRHGLQSPRR